MATAQGIVSQGFRLGRNFSVITSTIEISGDDLSVGRVYEVAVNRAPVSLAESCRGRVEKSWRLIESLVKGNKPVYGVTTGVGPLCNRLLPREKSEALQRNLVRALSAGVGSPLPVEAVRAMMLARANSFLKGQSGVRWSTIGTLVEMLNHGIHPLIPEVASVGASGDLGHLGHMALALMGEGKAEYQGGWMESRQAFQQSGLDPVVLAFKEGLALVNGTGYMTGVGALCVQQAEYLTGLVELCTALLVEVFGRSLAPFDLRIHRVKPYPGQVQAAANIAHFARDSRCTLSLEKLREVWRHSARIPLKSSSRARTSRTLIRSAASRRLRERCATIWPLSGRFWRSNSTRSTIIP